MNETRPSRRWAELALPGALVGALGGGFAATLAALAGQPPTWVALTAVCLSVPLALFGAGYSLLLARGTFRPGVFAPAAVFWFVGFPLARLLHESSVHSIIIGRPALPESPPAFLAFQAMVSVGFAIGFVWLHERIMPKWLIRVAEHNPTARALLTHYLRIAEQMRQQRAHKQAQRGGRTAPSGSKSTARRS